MGNKPSSPDQLEKDTADLTNHLPNAQGDNNNFVSTKKTHIPGRKSYGLSFKNPLKRAKPESSVEESKSEDAENDSATEKELALQRQNYVSLIQNRASNLFQDEDLLEGQEFYTEIRTKNSKHWTLKRIAKRHLSHIEFVKLKKPTLHFDCFRVMVPVADITRGRIT